MAYDENTARMEGLYRDAVRHCEGDARGDDYTAFSQDLIRKMFDAATAEKYEQSFPIEKRIPLADVKTLSKDDCKKVVSLIEDWRAFMSKPHSREDAIKEAEKASLTVIPFFPDR